MKKPKRPGKIIAVANRKGGVGKTTIATNLAVMFATEGYEVMLIDADPEQQSSMNWSSKRENEELSFIQCGIVSVKDLKRQSTAFRDKYDVVIIDGGAGINDHARAACAVADFLIIPIKPSGYDADATADYLEAVSSELSFRDDLRVGLLLNEVIESRKLTKAIVEQVESWDNFQTFDSRLGFYQDFRDSATLGLGVTEYKPKGKAANQIQDFFKEVRGAIK